MKIKMFPLATEVVVSNLHNHFMSFLRYPASLIKRFNFSDIFIGRDWEKQEKEKRKAKERKILFCGVKEFVQTKISKGLELGFKSKM